VSTTSTTSSSLRSPSLPPRVPHSRSEVRGALDGLGLSPSKRLGQSFLVDPFVADAEAALLDTAPGTPVVEIGGGLGILTEAILRRGLGPLTVIERDRRLARHLRRTFADRIDLRVGDALELPLPSTAAVAGNLPFSVATPILVRLFEAGVPQVVVLVQKEVADRLAAVPGSKSYGRLTILCALYGEVEPFQVVPPRSFEPEPAVQGRIVRFRRRDGPLPVGSTERFERLLAGLFSSRRKQLRNLLPRVLGTREDPDDVAARSNWPSGWQRMRPEELPPEAYFRLARLLE
jgi:16S rRNA (adenine1518-N6/adenine1519-N6)-dimethyltransferase